MSRGTFDIFAVIVILLFVELNTVFAGKEHTFTLAEVQKFALENNRDIRTALLEIKKANKERWEVTASGFPQVEMSAQYQNLLDIPTQLIPGEIFGGEPGSTIPVKFGLPHNASYGISISQLIFSGSYFIGVQASNVYMQLSKQAHERTVLDIKATVTKSYYLVLVAERNREVLMASLENLNRSKFEVEEMYKEGFTEKSDVSQLQISVNQLENAISALEQQINVGYDLLKLQMGLPLNESITLDDNLDQTINTLEVDQHLDTPFDPYQNISMKALDTQEQLAHLSLRNERTTFLPTLVAFASAQRDAQREAFNLLDTDEDWYRTTIVGVKMSWPIFSGGSKVFRMQKARIELDQVRVQKEEVKEGLMLRHNQSRTALKLAFNNYLNNKQNRDLSKDVYETAQEKFREGLISSLELTQAHNQYLRSEGDYLKAVNDVLVAQTELKKILEEL